MPGRQEISIRSTVAQWWIDTRARRSFGGAAKLLASKLWEFVRDSTPQRKKQRYGDAEYDWEQRVNTTAATVTWRDRLLGQFLSPYQPTEPALFHEMLASLRIDFSQFTFIDIGSGKSRTLLMAADYPFRQVLGVEILPELHAVAKNNIASYHSASQKCFAVESRCQDARTFDFPLGPIVLYLFNPLPDAGLETMLRNLESTLQRQPSPVWVIYHNPELEHLFLSPPWTKVGGTHQYSVFAHLPSERNPI